MSTHIAEPASNGYKPGLEGVIAAETRLSHVDGLLVLAALCAVAPLAVEPEAARLARLEASEWLSGQSPP